MTPKDSTIPQNPQVDKNPHDKTQGDSSDSQVANANRPTKQFVERYWIALIITGTLFYISYSLLTSSLNKQSIYVTQISITEKQYLLNQEIVNQILLLRNCRQKKDCIHQLNILKRKAGALIKSQKKLVKGYKALKYEVSDTTRLSNLIKTNVRNNYETLNVVQKFILFKQDQLALHKNIIPYPDSSNIPVSNIKVDLSISNNINSIVQLYNEEAQAYIQNIKLYQGIVLIIAFMVLTLEALFLFPNIVKKIKLYTKNLEEAHLETQGKIRRFPKLITNSK